MIIIKYFKNIYKQYGIISFLLTVIALLSITIVIDYFNLFTFTYNKVKLPIIICISVFIIIKIISLKLHSLLFLKSVNYIDFYSMIVLTTIGLYKIMLHLFKSILVVYPYKDICSNIFLIIIGVLLVFRYLYITILNIRNKNKSNPNVFDLKQLYDNTIPKETEFILIGDEAVNYDLLERNKVITQITSTIINCNNDSKFVMSLKGDWGSGKTTILNNVMDKLKKENLVFIDDFEPWVYGDNKSLLVAFFDTIMKNTNCGFRINEINKFTKTYLKTITTNIGYSIDYLFENTTNIDRIKEIINNYLESNNKKIVLVLDNLERCSSEQILFILKTIHNLFDFKRIIYILSYDESAMKKHFESKLDIDYSYLEKIVQLEFSVPKLDRNVLQNVIKKCLNNYLSHSKLIVKDDEQEELIKIIMENVKDLRDFKRIINSTFNASFNNMKDLNSLDMLLIETIAMKSPELWNEINNNSTYYISEDRYVYGDEYIYSTEKYNIDTTKYFDDLFEKNKYEINKYKKILCYLFPNIKKYFDENRYNKKEKIEFIPEHQTYVNKKEYRASVLDKRIYNNKYFNLYFNKTENEFIKINEEINNFISFINNNNFKPEELYQQYFKMERIYPGWVEKYTLETFQMYLDKINKDKLLPLLLVMYFSYYKIDNSPLFFQLSANSRTLIIIADLILMLSDDDFEKFIDEIKDDFQNLYFIREIAYWLKPEHRHDELVNTSRYEVINSLYENMLENIKTNKINMYNNEYYNRYNMVLLFDDEKYMSFIKKKINKDNLMLFILDCISISTGSYGIGYNFNTQNLDKFYGWEKAKKDIKKCPESDLKDFLVKAIETPNPYNSIDEKDTYHVEEWIDLNSLIIKYLNR